MGAISTSKVFREVFRNTPEKRSSEMIRGTSEQAEVLALRRPTKCSADEFRNTPKKCWIYASSDVPTVPSLRDGPLQGIARPSGRRASALVVERQRSSNTWPPGAALRLRERGGAQG